MLQLVPSAAGRKRRGMERQQRLFLVPAKKRGRKEREREREREREKG
jgi:hypothetical protein